MNHALAASDYERAARLVEQNTLVLLPQGKLHTLLRWIRALPEEVARRRAEQAHKAANLDLMQTVSQLEQENLARRLAEEQLRLADEVFQNTDQGIVVTSPEGCIQSINPAFTRITGYSEAEAHGQNIRLLKSGRHDRMFYQNMWAQLLATGKLQTEVWNRRKNGEVYPQQGNISAQYDEQGTLKSFIYVFSDITQIKQSEKDLEKLMHYDVLTGLPNRLLLGDRLRQSMDAANDEHRLVGVLHLDINRFKRVNDSFGYSAGDQLLKDIVARLQSLISGNDTIARVGDDDFVIIATDVTSVDSLGRLAQALIELIGSPFEIAGSQTTISCNIGITAYPLDDSEVEALINDAETALARAKKQGADRYEFFTRQMGLSSARQLSQENALRRAIENRDFTLHFQPQIIADTGKIYGAEALVRWKNRDTGRLEQPDMFIPLAEESGLIIPLSEWILRSACQQAAAWQQQGLAPVKVGVNVSALQMTTPISPPVSRRSSGKPSWTPVTSTWS